MVAEPKVVHVEPDSELGRLLEEAGEAAVQLGQRGAIYRLERVDEDVPNRRTDPEWDARVADSRTGIVAAAGGWRGNVDGAAFKEYIRERRKTKNRPAVRW